MALAVLLCEPAVLAPCGSGAGGLCGCGAATATATDATVTVTGAGRARAGRRAHASGYVDVVHLA